MTKKIVIGNSTAGYATADVIVTKSGKIRLVKESINGRVTVIKKCIANYNNGIESYVTRCGDELPFSVK